MSGAAVARVGARCARENCGEFAGAGEQEGRADGEHASMDLVQVAATKANLDLLVRQSGSK